MPTNQMPAAEVEISIDLVRRLLRAQHPELSHLVLELLTEGWDNASYRLGEELLVRLPRRSASAPLIEHERLWLPKIAGRLPLPIPVPLYSGAPGEGFPWPWSICRYIPGVSAAVTEPDDLNRTAEVLGGFLRRLHSPAPSDAPANPYRGGPLLSRDATTRQRLDMVSDLGFVAFAELERLWVGALELPAFGGEPTWLHGDLHPHNILVDDGRLSGIVDFGDITSGDPATDLSVAWMMLPAESHRSFRHAYGDDSRALWGRARGWAIGLGLAYVATSADNPVMASIGRRTLVAALDDRS